MDKVSASPKVDDKLSKESEARRREAEEKRFRESNERQEQLKLANSQHKEDIKAAASKPKVDMAVDPRTEFVRKKMEEKRQEFLRAKQAAKEAKEAEYKERIKRAGSHGRVDQVCACLMKWDPAAQSNGRVGSMSPTLRARRVAVSVAWMHAGWLGGRVHGQKSLIRMTE